MTFDPSVCTTRREPPARSEKEIIEYAALLRCAACGGYEALRSLERGEAGDDFACAALTCCRPVPPTMPISFLQGRDGTISPVHRIRASRLPTQRPSCCPRSNCARTSPMRTADSNTPTRTRPIATSARISGSARCWRSRSCCAHAAACSAKRMSIRSDALKRSSPADPELHVGRLSRLASLSRNGHPGFRAARHVRVVLAVARAVVPIARSRVIRRRIRHDESEAEAAIMVLEMASLEMMPSKPCPSK